MDQDFSVEENDVLCGRGGGTNNYVGNKRFRTLVSVNQKDYLLARKKDKSAIAKHIVQIVQRRGGRFLRKDTMQSTWVEVGDQKAAEKTSQALREGLDVRHKEFRGKAKRRDSDSSSDMPPTKRRRIHTKEESMYFSPALVSECDSMVQRIPDFRQQMMSLPHFIYRPSHILDTDCDHVESV